MIPSFGPGGTERQLSILAPALARTGVEVHIGYCNDGPNLERLRGGDVYLHHLACSSNYSPALAWKLISLIRQLQPDVVQTWLLQMDVLGGLAALLNRVPFILSERSSAGAYAPSWKTRWRLMVGRRAACVVANSGGGVDYWRSHLPKGRLFLIRNCILQTEDMQEAPDLAASISAGTPIVLFAGRFSYEKNIPRLIEALITVATQRPDVAIMMFGEGPDRRAAEVRIAESGKNGQIRIAGHSTHLSAWMSHAAVCISVSHFEGQPNVVMEAAAVGCPLVLSDIPAHRELFDESEVLFTPADSSFLIANAVLEALQRPIQARERAQRARGLTQRFNLPAVLTAYKAVYEAAVAARP